jgi:hypothetical protein
MKEMKFQSENFQGESYIEILYSQQQNLKQLLQTRKNILCCSDIFTNAYSWLGIQILCIME